MPRGEPTILLVDVTEKTASALAKLPGIQFVPSSFGSPYAVEVGSRLCTINIDDTSLPDYKEADGFVIDLRTLPARTGIHCRQPPDLAPDIFTSGVNGFIDPRPFVMSMVAEDFQRISNHGGLFIVFAQPLESIDYIHGNIQYGSHLEQTSRDRHTNYSFLPILTEYLGITTDRGTEMSGLMTQERIGHLLAKHLDKGNFTCTFRDHTDWKQWAPLAINKFGNCVAAARVMGKNHSLLLLLPTVTDEPGFLTSLFREVLPELCPHLFPNLQRGTWALAPPYEMASVIHLQHQARQIEEAAKKQVAKIIQNVSAERAANAFLFDLVRGTGDALVKAVEQAISELGFRDVLNVDEHMKAEVEDPDLREDLQIRDRSPLLTVDVKGLSNFPADSDALQAHKHASIRMQELQRLDIGALAIINHQRNIPPLERENTAPFRDDLLKVAAQVKMGLLTGWDLHRLVRNKKKWGWNSNDVMPVLYRVGRIEPIPEHYTRIGTVEHFYEQPKVASIRIAGGVLRRSDRIAFEFPVEFEELNVESMQVDRTPVEEAIDGSLCGVVTPFKRSELKIGTKVYVIRPAQALPAN